MCYELVTISLWNFWKFGINWALLVILSCNKISNLKIDSVYSHDKFYCSRFFHTIRLVYASMEIKLRVFHQTLWNLAWLYIKSIFRLEIWLQLEITNWAQFIPHFQKFHREIGGNLKDTNSKFPHAAKKTLTTKSDLLCITSHKTKNCTLWSAKNFSFVSYRNSFLTKRTAPTTTRMFSKLPRTLLCTKNR